MKLTEALSQIYEMAANNNTINTVNQSLEKAGLKDKLNVAVNPNDATGNTFMLNGKVVNKNVLTSLLKAVHPDSTVNSTPEQITQNVNQALSSTGIQIPVQQAQTQPNQAQPQNTGAGQSRNAQTLQTIANNVKGAASAVPVVASVGAKNNGEMLETPSGKQVAKVNYNTIKSASDETEQKFKNGQANKYISIGKQTKDDPSTKLPAGSAVMMAKDNQRTNKISLNTAVKMLQNIAAGQPAETGVNQNEMVPVTGNDVQDLSPVSDAQELQVVQQSDQLPAIQGQGTGKDLTTLTNEIAKLEQPQVPQLTGQNHVEDIQNVGNTYMEALNLYGKWMSYIDPKQVPASIQNELERALGEGDKNVKEAAKDGENSGKGSEKVREWFKKNGGWTGILGNVAEVLGRFVGGMGAGSEMKK